MTRRLHTSIFAALLGLATLLGNSAPAVANHLECGTADPHDMLPANGGRVAVVYENELLRSPAFPDATVVAGHVKQRAEAALDRYAQLGFTVPPAVTISIKCRLSAVGLIEIDAQGYQPGAWRHEWSGRCICARAESVRPSRAAMW